MAAWPLGALEQMPMPFHSAFFRRFTARFAVIALTAMLAGCVGEDDSSDFVDRAYQPLSPQTLALMQAKGTNPQAPVLFRTYKKEAEFEIWKQRDDGRYVLLRTYPMCRWSGQLGPKKRKGDRQVPEGFYPIYPSQMNPRSSYYLSFNVGYPNVYDRAHGYSGDSIMVHGICSSAGCFSMTNMEIAEIYAIAREAFAGGQPEIQMQSMPFHMTAENFAKYRLDPNIAFWRELKTGTDNFEVTKEEVRVGVCNLHYVFNATPANGERLDPSAPCPALKRDQMVAEEVLAKEARDDARIAELAASGLPAVHTVYADGGQNPTFRGQPIEDVSRPDALVQGPVDVAIKRHGKAPTEAQLKVARAKDLAAADAAEKKARALALARGESEPAVDPQPTASTTAAAQPASTGAAPPAVPNPQTPPQSAAPATPLAALQTASAPAPQRAPSQGSFFSFFGAKPAVQPAPAAQAAAASPAPAASQNATSATSTAAPTPTQ
ncbi:murein L,D-transpeptidase YafK [Methylovirgula ligni]|uniref:Murein L,D-transpeptidase YafK n=3 Tax=Methylovirgula ligni TaxID=569860 RepID=A0A3D9Z2C1_9HYPH|nr:murein L,D-transpeptidase YafK [Methylovirgula ligni]